MARFIVFLAVIVSSAAAVCALPNLNVVGSVARSETGDFALADTIVRVQQPYTDSQGRQRPSLEACLHVLGKPCNEQLDEQGMAKDPDNFNPVDLALLNIGNVDQSKQPAANGASPASPASPAAPDVFEMVPVGNANSAPQGNANSAPQGNADSAPQGNAGSAPQGSAPSGALERLLKLDVNTNSPSNDAAVTPANGQSMDGAAAPANGQMPNGAAPATNGQVPNGATPATNGQAPNGAVPATNGQSPNGAAPAANGQSPSGAAPANGQSSGVSVDSPSAGQASSGYLGATSSSPRVQRQAPVPASVY